MPVVAFPARKTDRIYTYGDYRNWPRNERWELIDGVAWSMSPAPSPRHQRMLLWMAARIEFFLEGKSCRCFPAPFDVLLRDTPEQQEDDVISVVQPDITVVCGREKMTPRGCFGAPEFLVEFLSPYTSKKDLNDKHLLYERHGVLEYWVIDPAGEYLHIYRLDDVGTYGDPVMILTEGKASSSVLDGFSFELAELFAADSWPES